jgi:diaminohydroxyphosphoribosylaminopyrimidine deaminase/5-amino-6-(5-phosphoribosylamino)uracil reductase
MTRKAGRAAARKAVDPAVDRRHMARCLELARKAEGRTAPNPIVGGVIVDRRGKVIAEGFHAGPGHLHGEAAALAELGGKAAGATLYVNLEPCNHHGRTPPCAPAVRAAGVARVVIGMLDPVPDHGGGAKLLRRAGIAVTTGVLAAECAAANRPFVSWATRGRPWFVLKAATSLDGKIATPAGESRWITGEPARADGHRLRDRCDAIMVGVGTVLADDPQLTVRGVRGGRDPVRVIVDSSLRTPPTAKVLPKNGGSPARTIIAATEAAPSERVLPLVEAGAEVWWVATAGGKVSLRSLASALAANDLTSVLVEGGGELHAAMIRAGLADELRIYVAASVIGGPAPGWVGGTGAATLADARRWRWDAEPARVGDDVVLRAVAADAI